MRLLRKIHILTERCEASERRCEIKRIAAERRRREICAEQDATQAKKSGIRQLMALARPQGQLDRAGLFVLQRRLAVLRQQTKDIELQEKKLAQDLVDVEQRLLGIACERQQWRRKHDKYQRWADVQKKRLRLDRLLQEETEMQEIITWKF